jgi:hypothetical protein
VLAISVKPAGHRGPRGLLTWAGLPPAGSHQLAWRTHSITWSAMASRFGGMERLSALAVLRLMASSNLVGCSTGTGFAPFKIRAT